MVKNSKSLYLEPELARLWDSIPTGERNMLINKVLRNYAESNDIDPKVKIIRKLELEVADLQMKATTVEKEIEQRKMMLESVRNGNSQADIDVNQEWAALEDIARKARESGVVWSSYAGRAQYRVHDVFNGRIYIENISTGRTSSNFQNGTLVLGLQRLMNNDGRIKQLEMIPVKMHEYAITRLHPKLKLEDGYIVYRGDE
jgi:DNA-binding protein H-NS